jgi:cytidylate kinase
MDSARRGLLIAIDGPAGSGKSTLAERLAGELDLPYVNTGLMYRALTLAALKRKVDPRDAESLTALLLGLSFDLNWNVSPPSLWIDGEPPTPDLTGRAVERTVSLIAGHPAVRELMRQEQRRLGSGGAVMEGRDIGTVIFPDAEVKIFLVASSSERIARRLRERSDPRAPDAGVMSDGSVADDLALRDARDSRVNPFVAAADALLIDTGGRGADAVFEEALDAVRRRLPSS